MLVTTKEMFKKSIEEKFAVGAFNINNMEFVQAIMDAAALEKSPVILQTSSSAIKYARIPYLKKMIEAGLEEHDIPVALHLDHGTDFETCKMCIDGGYTSVMFDGSIFIEILAYIPLLSVMIAPPLYLIGEISLVGLGISTLLTVIASYLLYEYGLRIYKVGILNYSSSKLWRKMFKSLKNKE